MRTPPLVFLVLGLAACASDFGTECVCDQPIASYANSPSACAAHCRRDGAPDAIVRAPLAPAPSGAPRARIPLRLHQMWKSELVPASYAPYVRSWLRLHPSWEYVFWSDGDIAWLFERHGLGALHARLRSIQRADAARYVALGVWGGVYADLDMEALRPLDPLLGAGATLLLGQEPRAHARLLNNMERLTCNAILGAAPRHPFWPHVLRALEAATRRASDPVSSTGPRMLEQAVRAYGPDAERAIAPPETFYPCFGPIATQKARTMCARGAPPAAGEWQRKACDELRASNFSNAPSPDSYTDHHWTHSWLGQVDTRSTFNVSALLLASARHHERAGPRAV